MSDLIGILVLLTLTAIVVSVSIALFTILAGLALVAGFVMVGLTLWGLVRNE